MKPLDVMVYDETDTVPGVELADSWHFGGILYKTFKALDLVIPAGSWHEAISELNKIKAPIKSIQFWGHGSPGHFYINGKSIFEDFGIHLERSTFKVQDLIWFRSCGTFALKSGHDFAEKISDRFQCNVAGHTYVIGPLQSGLHTLRFGAKPHWSTTEGTYVDKKTKKIKIKNSYPWEPNTITCLHSEIPKGW